MQVVTDIPPPAEDTNGKDKGKDKEIAEIDSTVAHPARVYDNLLAVAQKAAPSSRIVYADYDPIVLAHAHALLESTPEGATAYIHGDLREPEPILEGAAATLDFSQPVALV